MNANRKQKPEEDVGDFLANLTWLAILIAAIVCGIGACASIGCTVRPKMVQNSQPSFDGNAQNSGLIGHDEAGNAVISPHARDRYNTLMDDYGKLFRPPVNRDDGITATATNTFLLDAQHEFVFSTANRWRRYPHGAPGQPEH